MIQDATGNLLEANAEALVNTVNCVGFMGKGIALQFKQAWPDNFEAYARASKAGEIRPGRMFIWETGRMINPKFIINFPTKRHWRGKSKIEDIKSGLRALIGEVRHLGIRSIAVPPLGCGNGGLNWKDVRPLIEAAFAEIPDVEVLLYRPQGAPPAPDPYFTIAFDPATDAMAAVDRALGAAKHSGKRVLLVMGSNRCHDSAYFANVIDRPRFVGAVAERYHVVFVDIGAPQAGAGRNLRIDHRAVWRAHYVDRFERHACIRSETLLERVDDRGFDVRRLGRRDGGTGRDECDEQGRKELHQRTRLLTCASISSAALITLEFAS